MNFPDYRGRRVRRTEGLRRMVRETRLSVDNLCYPLFCAPGQGVQKPIASMPGQHVWSVDKAVDAAAAAYDAGIPSVILFGIPEKKDAVGSEAWSANGVVQRAIKAIKKRCPELVVVADACFCEYTDHGHCGVLKRDARGEMVVDNDATLDVLARSALAQAAAGADVIAPSDMMDGRVGAIRRALDGAGHSDIAILSYAVKYASSFYGPFRDAADCAPKFGDRAGYQMDPGNSREALRELALDEEEGADMVMVKPALPYLDIIAKVREHTHLPVGAYNVSGEYAMIKAAVAAGMLDERRATLEALLSIRRAGADFILTYHAVEAARWLGA